MKVTGDFKARFLALEERCSPEESWHLVNGHCWERSGASKSLYLNGSTLDVDSHGISPRVSCSPTWRLVNLRLCCGDQGAAITRVIFLIFSCKSVSQARPLLSSQAVIHPGDHDEGSRDFQTPGKKIRGPWCQRSQWQTWRGCELQAMWRKMEGRW